MCILVLVETPDSYHLYLGHTVVTENKYTLVYWVFGFCPFSQNTDMLYSSLECPNMQLLEKKLVVALF